MIDQLGDIQLLLAAVVSTAVVTAAVSAYFYKDMCGYRSTGREPYHNGVSVLFALQMAVAGPGFQTFMKLTSKSTRRRLYSGFKNGLIFGREIWTAGHPGIVKHVFNPANSKLFYKASKKELKEMFWQGDEANNAMLYSGDDAGWKHARVSWSPFFMRKDFTVYDEKIDEVVSKHLERLTNNRAGRVELLELMLYITIDLLCQVLYGAVLPCDELNILVEALAEFTVPATSYRGKYPGGLNCVQYHSKVAKAISDAAPDGVFCQIILKDNNMSSSLRYENCAFFLEALTPAFASFWTICNVMQHSAIEKDIKDQCLNDPLYREKCIKESLRMYPPVPALWPRCATKTHSMDNPLYDPTVEDNRSILGKLFSNRDIRMQQEIKIKKGTAIFVVPSCLHYDDRVWMNPEEFLPQRWDKDPKVINENATTDRKARKSMWGGLNSEKDNQFQEKLTAARKKNRFTKASSAYDHDTTPIRYKLFGNPVEEGVEAENLEMLKAAAVCEDSMAYTYMPFGLGKHQCLGRRLALKFVDGIVANLLAFDLSFENGVTPNLFKRKWYDRLNGVSAAYNYPADPVYVEISDMKGDISRIQDIIKKKKRRTRMNTIVTPLLDLDEFQD